MEKRVWNRAHYGTNTSLRISGGHPACRGGWHLATQTWLRSFRRQGNASSDSAGRDARLYGRQDARRYVVAVPCAFWKLSACFGNVAR